MGLIYNSVWDTSRSRMRLMAENYDTTPHIFRPSLHGHAIGSDFVNDCASTMTRTVVRFVVWKDFQWVRFTLFNGSNALISFFVAQNIIFI